MATAGIYYIDTFNFADATAVYTDAALTTFAADGFYQMGGVTARQQVSGVLKPAESCPSCAKPSPDPVPPTNNAFKITDTLAGTQDHVVLNNNFSVGQEVTTSINSNCWLIDSLAVNGTSNTITGGCVPDPGTPALYYLLNLCPVSASTGAKSAIYTSITPTSNQFIYLNTNLNAYYSYNNAAPVTTLSSGIPLVENGLALTADAGCPAVPTVFTYWNAQECNNPNITIVIQAPDGTAFNEGTTSVKINGSTTCYQINSQRIGSATTFDGVYAGTAYTGCTSGTNPCIPPIVVNNSFVAREITTNVEYDVQLGSGQIGDETQISAASGCYKLVSTTTRTTTNTITTACPTPTLCAEYELSGNWTGKDCLTGGNISGYITIGDSAPVCGQVDSFTSDQAGFPEYVAPCFETQSLPTSFNYYTAVACLYPNSTPIIVRNNGSVIPNGYSVKVSGSTTCYLITGPSNNQSSPSDITNEYPSGCSECNPPVSCFPFSVDSNTSNTTCPENNPTTVYGDTDTFTTATKLYINQAGCQSGQAAAVGTYAMTINNQRVSRYWDGSNLFPAQTCTALDVNVTGTISSIDNQITGSAVGVGYTITGSSVGSQTTGVSPLSIPSGGSSPFNTSIALEPGYSITTAISVSYNPTSITQDSNIVVTLTGEVTQDAVTTYVVRTCGTNVVYNLRDDSNPKLNPSTNDVFYFTTDTGVTACGLVTGTTTQTSQGRLIYQITSGGCDNSTCSPSGGAPAF